MKISRCIFCALALLGGGVQAAKIDRVAAYKKYEEGNALYTDGDLAGAVLKYNEALELDPGHADTLTNLGSALQDLGYTLREKGEDEHVIKKYTVKAIHAYEKAIVSNPFHAMAHYNLGMMVHDSEPEEARLHYEAAIEADPTMGDAWSNLATVLHTQGQYFRAVIAYEEAIAIFEQSTEINVVHLQYMLSLHRHCGEALVMLPDDACEGFGDGDTCLAQAERHFEEALRIDPDNAVVQHNLASLRADGEAADAVASEFIKQLFDDYAPSFEASLGGLEYKSPETLWAAVTSLRNEFRVVADVGCGTGLMGKLMRNSNSVEFIIGVDISANMLEHAHASGVYDGLYAEDAVELFTDWRNVGEPLFDLIVAADVFVYQCNLHDTIQAMSSMLAAGGMLGFTLELLDNAEDVNQPRDWFLQPSGRCSHTKEYVMSIIENLHMKVDVYETYTPRMEGGKPVPGQLFVLSKGGMNIENHADGEIEIEYFIEEEEL